MGKNAPRPPPSELIWTAFKLAGSLNTKAYQAFLTLRDIHCKFHTYDDIKGGLSPYNHESLSDLQQVDKEKHCILCSSLSGGTFCFYITLKLFQHINCIQSTSMKTSTHYFICTLAVADF